MSSTYLKTKPIDALESTSQLGDTCAIPVCQNGVARKISGADLLRLTAKARQYPVSIEVEKLDYAVTVTTRYVDDSVDTSVIMLDEYGDPVSITAAGVTCDIVWRGFDE